MSYTHTWFYHCHSVNKIPWKRNLWESGFTWVHCLRVWFIVAGKLWQQEPEAVGHLTLSIGRRQRWKCILPLGSFSPSMWSSIPAREWHYPQWAHLPASIRPVKIVPQRRPETHPQVIWIRLRCHPMLTTTSIYRKLPRYVIFCYLSSMAQRLIPKCSLSNKQPLGTDRWEDSQTIFWRFCFIRLG